MEAIKRKKNYNENKFLASTRFMNILSQGLFESECIGRDFEE